jgi:hypothetical protein
MQCSHVHDLDLLYFSLKAIIPTVSKIEAINDEMSIAGCFKDHFKSSITVRQKQSLYDPVCIPAIIHIITFNKNIRLIIEKNNIKYDIKISISLFFYLK